MNDELNSSEEHFIDTMLAETLGKAAPPDLSEQILRRLSTQGSVVAPLISANQVPAVPAAAPAAPATKSIAVIVTVIATLAASVMFALWVRSPSGLPDAGDGIVANGPGISEGPTVESPIDVPRSDPNQSLAPHKPPRGIPLVVRPQDSGEQELPVLMPEQNVPESLRSSQPVQPLTLVSKQVDAELKSYWNAVGITPSSDASVEEIAQRLSRMLRIELPIDVLADPEQLRIELTQTDAARAIAGRWLRQISGGGLARVSKEGSDELVTELATSLEGGSPFDSVLAKWINGQSPNAATFYAAMTSGPPHANDQSAMMRRLASITMNVDLRCTRCHDSYIEGKGRQEDFWSLAAFLRRGVKRGGEVGLQIDPPQTSPLAPLFYESSDGRQRVAEPGIADRWLHRRSGEPIQSVKEWSERLIGSEALARGVVNSLWEMVHGQPLRGRVVDPISAPHNDSLDRLEENLVQDLVRSNFDVARSLSLIIASPVTRRGVPAVLLPENALVAEESETRKAMNAVDAFAASLPLRQPLPIPRRVAQALRSVGASLDANGQPFVAQIGENGNAAAANNTSNGAFAADFPRKASSLPVQWLSQIEDQQSRVDHLAYLAGMSKVPDDVSKAAEITNEVEDPNTALHRVWWLVRP